MVLLARVVRLSRRPAAEAMHRGFSATTGGGSSGISSAAAPSKLKLPEGSSSVEPGARVSSDICAMAASTEVKLPRPQMQIAEGEMKDASVHRTGVKLLMPSSSIHRMNVSRVPFANQPLGFPAAVGISKLPLKVMKPMSFSSVSGRFNNFPPKSIEPKVPRVIIPGSMPPVEQLNFFTTKDVAAEDWKNPVDYLLKNPPFCEVKSGLFSSKPIPEEHYRVLERSLVNLVHENKQRGIDITPSLRLENLYISPTHGTFALKINAYTLISDSSPFLGYKAAGELLEKLLNMLYGNSVLHNVSSDVGHLHSVLDRDMIDDEINLYNAALLCREGRANLSVKIDMFLRHDIWKRGKCDKETSKLVTIIYTNMPTCYISQTDNFFPTDHLHDDFRDMRKKTKEIGAAMESTKVQQDQFSDDLSQKDQNKRRVNMRTTGKWLVMLNRIGVLHPKVVLHDAVDQLHSWIPDYLPLTQEHLRSHHEEDKIWDYFDWKSFFPK